MALRLKGSSSGYAEIDAAAVAGDVTLTLPSTTGTINVKDGSGTTNVGTGVNLGNPSANIFTISNTGGERLRIAADGAVTIPGNLNISGVLTYEDVTSVDAIGLSTFRDGLITKDVGITTITSSDINGDTVTAVDVFVYDTSKDSDGGAWRKRTSHTSWYNETLGTATRGSRKEFPAVAVIVAEAAKVTIYDGDDPDLPMWMVLNADSSDPTKYAIVRSVGKTISSLYALNGIICDPVSFNGLFYQNFAEDACYRVNTTNTIFGGNIVNRNGGMNFALNVTSSGLIHSTVNDVAMTVLPNAPIDSATGLPTPTIAVATDGGVSVIKDDGNVVDITSSKAVNDVDLIHFDKSGRLYFAAQASSSVTDVYQFNRYIIPSSDISNNVYEDNADATYFAYATSGSFANIRPNFNAQYNDGINEDITTILSNNDGGIVGNVNGLSLFVEDYSAQNNGMVAYAATSYNTGYMHGDIKGAFLSGISTTFTYGSELVTNGTFASDISGWTGFNSVLTHQTDAIRVADNGSYSKAYQSFTTVVGKEYLVKVVVKTVSGGAAHCNTGSQDPADVSGNDFTIITNITATGTYYNTFTANASTSYIEVWSDGVNYVEYSELSVKENAPGLLDRSVNKNGLIQYGTVTKSAGATGAELVGYGPFTTSNYLQQSYNSDLQFGTGDFSVTWWMKITGDISGTGFVFDRRNTGSRFTAYYTATEAGRLYFQTYEAGGGGGESQMYAENIDNYKDTWTCYTLTRSGTNMTIYINGKVGYQATLDVRNIDDATAPLYIGVRHNETDAVTQGELSLMRFSASIPSSEQVKKMYEDEKVLFQENAKCTLYGSSDAVTALAYDDTTNLLHVGTSAGRSEFQGLCRINNTTDAVTTAISASNGLVAEQ